MLATVTPWAVEGSDGVCPSLHNQRTAVANTIPWDLRRLGLPSSEALLLLLLQVVAQVVLGELGRNPCLCRQGKLKAILVRMSFQSRPHEMRWSVM